MRTASIGCLAVFCLLAIQQQTWAQAVEEEPRSIAGETSVKPGINEGFLNPELDVDEMVERFEMESREIFVARERILAACGIEKGHEVADIGAGTGLFSRMFAVEVGNDGWVFAVDIAPRLIKHITEESTRQELNNVTGVVCAENSVNLPPGSVDVVFICDTYHHFEYPQATMASIRRALRPGGHLILIDFERIPGESREWILGHVRAGKEEVRGEIEDADFEYVAESDIDGLEENYFIKFRKN
ncbi:MAG: class I SAM-dependent methyltransferase [Pirellulaceae bacterium]